MIEIIEPIRIIDVKDGENTENLLTKKPLQIGLDEAIFSHFSKGGYVILDYGKEMCGSLRVLNCRLAARVRIRFGESVTECCSELKSDGQASKNDNTATNDHSLRDFEVFLPMLSDQTFGNTGFRFVRIDFYGDVKIKSLVAVNSILNRASIYTYSGKDELIKKIFEAAKRTVDLCAASGYVWDGVKRDRLVWVGDMHPETLAFCALYGKCEEIERSLEFIKEQTPLPGWMNGMPMYSLWWLIITADYRKLVNADEFAEKQLGYVNGIIGLMENCVKDDGELNYPAYFVDWPTVGKADALEGCRALNVIAAKKATELLEYFGKDASKAKALLEKLNKKPIIVKEQKQVMGLKFFANGKLSEAEKQMLICGGAKGMSTFMSYYILKAVASFDKEKAVQMMKDYYGGMLAVGATTFFEDFDCDWIKGSCHIDEFPKKGEKDIHGDFGDFCYKGFRHSLCHGWSAGVIAFIKEYCN